MITAGELFEKAIDNWRNNKGIGTAIIPHPLNEKLMVLGVLQRIYARSPTANVAIVTNSFSERQTITEYITQQKDSEENNEEFKNLIKSGNLKVFTDKYIISNKTLSYPLLCIWYKPDSVCQEMLDYVRNCKFKLIVLTKITNDFLALLDIYKIAPLLSDFEQAEVEAIRMTTPVEEIQIGVDIPANSNAVELLKYYDEYISTSLNIFGSFNIMQQANVGNQQLNISATQICYQIAQENGWNEHLDMSIGFNLEIDRLYNPNNLKDRASKTYEVIRERSKLLSDFEGKLDAILDIVRENRDKKILIINKRADFASIVTDYLNNLSDKDICGNYHDKVENIPAITLEGTPVFYKSGSKKGERKMMGAKAQKTLNVERFNQNMIHVLSTNNAPDKDLAIDVDIMIITSPMCEDIKSYMYRLSKIYFRSQSISLYSLYCKNTVEQKMIERKEIKDNHNVKNSNANDIYSDFIVVD
ncbi:MAG: putative SWI2/SNF2 ATPase [crAssphage sp. isolate ctcc615]|uniref:SWI2/SNF2 ATPase n=1 Tax=crAssphage sp. isolate ctcc615 TaxID=2989853 RepID=A0A345BP32_9CAUD|nr:MAG: putative SWI2/SNF2 ATPase [crAssphage sp. isolate ctcc615]AXF52203.1 MAG: putative SWI2/SNF2 ATPase [crAssphage sp. isolate ctcc615]